MLYFIEIWSVIEDEIFIYLFFVVFGSRYILFLIGCSDGCWVDQDTIGVPEDQLEADGPANISHSCTAFHDG